MSGPKKSFYELSERSKKIIASQMSCEQQSVLCTQQIQELLHSVLSYSGEIQKQISLLDILESRSQEEIGKKEKHERILENLETETTRLKSDLSSLMPQVSISMRITEKALDKKKQELSKLRGSKK